MLLDDLRSTVNSHYIMMTRDIYKRDTLVQQWISKVKDANIPYQDKEDILKFVDLMLREGRSALRVYTYIAVLLQAKKVIRKPFRECSKEDIQHYINYIEDNYSLATQILRKSILKLFFKVMYGNNEYYPDTVRWIKLKVNKDKQKKEEQLSYDQFLTEDEIKLLIDTANTIQRKALIAVGYETGARPEELLNIRIKDIMFDNKGAKVILRGKTVERVTRVIAYLPLLKQWLSIHPFRNDPNAYLWLSESSNCKWKPIGIQTVEKTFKTIMRKAGIQKRPRLYILRHSRATHLANKLTEAQMCAYFGWQLGTKVVQRYIHLAGVKTDDALLELAGVKVDKDNESSALKVRYCKRCNEMLSPNHEFCIRCGYSDKDVITATTTTAEGNVSREVVDRINRLEAILSVLASRLGIADDDANGDDDNHNNADSKKRKKGKVIA
jgi:integrase/recombinase XerD